MAKQGGLGDALYVGGYDIGCDVGALSRIAGGPAALEVTGICKSAFERIGGVRDGGIEFTAFFNPAVGRAQAVLSALPTADRVVTYCRSTILGAPAAAEVAKQINYDGTRGQDGSFTYQIQALANGFGLEWGNQLTAGTRTDTAATNGTSIDTGASLSFGAQAYLHVTAFTGTDVTVKIQDSADDSSFADVAGLAFTQITAAPTAERIAVVNTATIRRYVRAVTVTTGGVTSVSFQAMINKNPVAGVKF